MSTILPFFLIIGSLVAIIVIVIRKYPQITLLDVENISEAKEEKKKNEFLKKRADKRADLSKKQLGEIIQPITKKAKDHQKKFRSYVGKIQKTVADEMKKKSTPQKPVVAKTTEEKDKVGSLLKDAQHHYDNHEYDKAEKIYIQVIRLDNKNTVAYEGLGDVYFAQEQFLEAEETYSFLSKLDKKNDKVYVRLSEVAEAKKETDKAIEYLQKANEINDSKSVRFAKLTELLQRTGDYNDALESIQKAMELEPENPKYIDKLIEISIIVGNKKIAKSGLSQLKKVNPENNKLALFEQKIADI